MLFDGAMGARLLDAGLPIGTPPEVWNVDRPATVEGIHKAYLAAGAEVVTTNTFGGTPVKLAAHGIGERCRELNLAGARLAVQAKSAVPRGEVFVAGDMGPCGKFFPPVGDLDEATVAEGARIQAELFVSSGVDLLLCETLGDLREAEIAVRALREVTDIPVVATMTFDKKRRGYFTVMGDRPGDAVRQLAEAGADAVGANCTLAPEGMAGLAEVLVAESPVPVLIQPNAGNPEMVEGRAVYRISPETFGAWVFPLLEMGVAAVGGCCGTGPAHIRFLAERMGLETSPAGEMGNL
ncbi:MAG: homocysteine S-methyltransferase family protein [Planctomycetota bacterium]|jgi:5-methyltetrahydrofolate--homocysteine methyltransferase